MSALCHELLTWPIDASRGGVARWKGWERWLSARVTVEKGVVGFGLEYACAHIIILAEISSENLLPIRADFVTERVNLRLRVTRVTRVTALECSTGEMSSLNGPEGREDKNGESAARLTMDAESEDVMEDSLDEIDEEGMTQPVPKLVRVFYYDLWWLQQGCGSTFTVRVLLTPSLWTLTPSLDPSPSLALDLATVWFKPSPRLGFSSNLDLSPHLGLDLAPILIKALA